MSERTEQDKKVFVSCDTCKKKTTRYEAMRKWWRTSNNGPFWCELCVKKLC